MAVDHYFETTYQLMMTEGDLTDRPSETQEITDWFIQRGGGLPMDFATAYCVFMRQLDIPSRMVVGYAVGEPINGGRAIKVFHMLFWCEVYIPLPEGGEWIQVIPYPLANLIQSTENPVNVGEGDVALNVGTNLGRIWVNIGEEFEINALLSISGSPVSTPEDIEFWDDTDNIYIGSSTITQGTYLPLANITYTFPNDATIGFHNISAIYISETYWIKNYTVLYAVATPQPLKKPKPTFDLDTTLKTIDVDLKQGLDTHEADWEDTVHVHGLLTVGAPPEPVDGDDLRANGYNDQMEIYWDEEWVGNGTIQADGTYELDIYIDPTDSKFAPGTHVVWSWYRGQRHPLYGFWILYPANSSDSEVTVYGRIEITLDVSPTMTSRGGDLLYDGTARFLNNTPLASEDIGLFLGGTKFIDIMTDSFGDFSYTYTVPDVFPLGSTTAIANWTTSASHMKGNWSNEIDIEILLLASDITIDSSPIAPEEVHMLQDIVIFGYLTDQANGSGLVGQEVSIWWGNDTSAINLGNDTVDTPDGFYQLVTQVPTNYEGSVNYWAIFDSPEPSYLGCRSGNLSIIVNRLNVEISIQVNPTPGHLLETITIEGIVTLPQISDILADAPITVWWSNISGTFNLGVDNTNSSGGYNISYQIPLNEAFGGVTIWANYSSHGIAYLSNESASIPILITNYDTNIDLSTNSTNYYLNNTILVYGLLERDDGVPIASELVDFYIMWHNGSNIHLQLLTNSSGYYNYTYALTVDDGIGTVTFDANFTSPTRLYEDSAILAPVNVNLVLYTFTLTGSLDSAAYHLDEVIQFSGTLIFDEGGIPATGKTITIWYQNETGTFSFSEVTNGAGDFTFLYPLSINDALGAIWVWANFTSINPLHDNASSSLDPATVIQYDLDVSFTTDKAAYYLDEAVHVTGRLTYVHNGTPLAGETIRFYWDNGTPYEFQNTTDVGGYFYLDYSLNPFTDSVGTVIIESNFTHFYKPWENDTWAHPGITLNRYSFNLDCFTNGTSFYLDQIVNVTGYLEFAHNNSEFEFQPVTINWYNGSLSQYQKITDVNGKFQFFYNLSTITDSAGPADVWLEFVFIHPLYNNATSNAENLTLNRYSFTLTCLTNSSSFYLDQVVNITGTLKFSHNNTLLNNTQVRITWFNGSLNEFFTSTDSAGYFGFLYNLSVPKDGVGNIDILAWFNNTNPLWNNASSSPPTTIALDRYSFSLTCLTNGTTFYLDQVVNITGTLQFLNNGSALIGEQVAVHWDNGSEYIFIKTTDSSGNFQFFYNLTGTKDSAGSVNVWLNFTNANPLWNDATSLPSIGLTLNRYDFTFTCFTNGTNFFLDQVVNVTGQLTFTHNSTGLVGQSILIVWDNGSEYSFPIFTGVNGFYQFQYSLSAFVDSPGSISVWANFTHFNPLWENKTSSPQNINLQQYQLQLDATVPPIEYLDQSVLIQGNLTHSAGLYPVAGLAVNIWYNDSSIWTLIGTPTTNSTGGFKWLFNFTVPPDSPGFYQFKCNTSTGPLYIDTSTGIFTVIAQKHFIGIGVALNPNPVYLNESLTIYVQLLFAYNTSPVTNVDVSIYWDWGNGTTFFIDNATTDPTGLATYVYSGMSDYTVWTGINIFANFSETLLIYATESLPESLTLQQWDSVITGFDTGGNTFRPLEIVTISGSLFYTNLAGPDVPFTSTDVSLFVNGTPLITIQTLSDGSFSYGWLIPSDAGTGIYTIEARFLSGVNWIANYNASSPITLVNYTLVWMFLVTPSPAHRTENMLIFVNLTLDNGSAYVGATIDIYWQHVDVSGLPILLDSVTTDANGLFANYYLLDIAVPLGTTDLWVSCTPSDSYVSPGVSNVESIQIELIPVNIDANVDTNFAYIGDSLIFSGTLTFGNLTPMSGYFVRIVWNAASPLYSWNLSLITDSSGYFQHNFEIPWDHPVGDSGFHAEFVKTSEAYIDNQTIVELVEIWDRVDIVLDADVVTVGTHNDRLDITGTVVNFGSQTISDVLVTLLIDGNVSRPRYEDVTDGNGQFTLSYLVPTITDAGYYIYSVNISSYYYLLNQSDFRNITIKLRSYLEVTPMYQNQWVDLMPGESFSISVQLRDATGLGLNDTYVEIYLNDTLLQTSYLASNDTPNEIQVVIPSSWALSGNYFINVTYSGASLLLPTHYEWTVGEDEDVHIFTEVYVTITGESVVAPLAPIQISGILIDDRDIPIVNRDVSMVYNGTLYHNVTTDNNGAFSYSNLPITNITGDYEYTITFYSEIENQVFGPFILTVRAGGGALYEPMTIVLWIGVIAVEMVIAFVLITRKRRSYTRLSALFHPKIGVGAKNNQHIMIRWL